MSDSEKSDSEKLVELIEELRERHTIPPEQMAAVFALVGLIRYSETVQK
jgi:hypothetical protein